MKRLLVVTILALLVFALTFSATACNHDSGTTDTPQPGTQTDPFYTNGYIKDTIPSFEFMYSDLIKSVTNSYNKMITTSITATNPYCTAVLGATLELNGEKFGFDLEFGYDRNSDEAFACNIRLTDKKGDTLMGVAYFNSKKADTVNTYITLAENKIKIPFWKEMIPKTFPLEANAELSEWFGNLFNSVIRAKEGTTKYEYQLVSGKVTRHYYFEVDILATLRQLFGLASLFDYDTKDINFILSNILGITETQINNGSIPDSRVCFEFKTVGGYQSSAGGGTIGSMNIIMDIEASEVYKDTVFEGKDYHIVATLNTIKVTNEKNTTIATESAYSGYAEYSDKTFRVTAETTFKDSTDAYNFDAKFLYDGINPEKTTIDVTVINARTEEERFSVNLSESVLNSTLTGKELTVPFDFGGLVTSVGEHFKATESDEPVSVPKVIAYIVGALRVNGSKVSFTFCGDKFSGITGLNAGNILQYLDDNTETDLAAYLDECGVDFAAVLQTEFKITIDLTEDFITQVK